MTVIACALRDSAVEIRASLLAHTCPAFFRRGIVLSLGAYRGLVCDNTNLFCLLLVRHLFSFSCVAVEEGMALMFAPIEPPAHTLETIPFETGLILPLHLLVSMV